MASSSGTVAIQIQVQNADEIAERLKKPPSERVDALTKKVSYSIQREIVASTPRRSGKLANSIKVEFIAPAWYVITENVAYGRLLRGIAGKGGYYIFPSKAGAIYWPERPVPSGWGAPHPFDFIGEPITSLHPGVRNPVRYDMIGISRAGAAIDEWMYDLPRAYAGMLEYGYESLAGGQE